MSYCCEEYKYRYVYGAAEPLTGESCFLVMPYCNTACMNIFLMELSKQYPDDVILLCCDGAAWHKANALCVPENIHLFFIQTYTPEINPIEQIWKELRRMSFRNEIFSTLEKWSLGFVIRFVRLLLKPFAALQVAFGFCLVLIRD